MSTPAPRPAEVVAAIALGSNLPSPEGDRAATIAAAVKAIAEISGVRVLRTSTTHETAPVGPVPQGPYLNACVAVATTLAPGELLANLLEIERSLGRDRSREQRWGPRTLDLDLILYGDLVIDEPGLHVPHPRMHERPFVLQPLAEVLPDAVHPVLKQTVRELRGSLTGR